MRNLILFQNLKLILSALLACLSSTNVLAQFYFIDFAGAGAANYVDSVRVNNITQETTLVMSGTDTLFLYGTVGFTDLLSPSNNEIILYPNPASYSSNLKVLVTKPGNHRISIFSEKGQLITSLERTLGAGMYEFEISGLPSGVFLFQLTSTHLNSGKKLIVTGSASGLPEIRKVAETPISSPLLLKSGSGVVEMQYNHGDRLLLTCYAGIYAVVIPLVATKSETITAQFVPCTDGDGNHYPVVYIGTQVWMAKNLATTKYSDGTVIPNVIAGSTWLNLTSGAYVWHGHNIAYKDVYGALYNWYATNPATNGNKNLCPDGWSVPDDADYTALTNFMGGGMTNGGRLKETGFAHWNSPNSGATNEWGFTALPGGKRGWDATFDEMGTHGRFWTANESHSIFGHLRVMFHNSATIVSGGINKNNGLSVRCIKNP